MMHEDVKPPNKDEDIKRPMTELMDNLQKLETAGAMREMPRFQCHKKVWALKIKAIRDTAEPGNESDGSRVIIPEEEGYAPFVVQLDYMRKHKPEVGGYYVVYEDGYKSYSPAKAFEDGYSRL